MPNGAGAEAGAVVEGGPAAEEPEPAAEPAVAEGLLAPAADEEGPAAEGRARVVDTVVAGAGLAAGCRPGPAAVTEAPAVVAVPVVAAVRGLPELAGAEARAQVPARARPWVLMLTRGARVRLAPGVVRDRGLALRERTLRLPGLDR